MGHQRMQGSEGSDAAGHAAAVRAAVLARHPVDDRERASIGAFVAHVDQLAEPFSEAAGPVHVTASAIVTTAAGTRVLLHRHKRLGLWLQPGGHVDEGESPSDAAVREAREETGLACTATSEDLVHVDVHPGPRGHTHLDLRYLVHAPHIRPTPPAGESQDVRWFTWAEAIGIAEAGLEGVLRATQPGRPILRRATAADAVQCAHVFRRSRRFGLPAVPTVDDPAELRRWMADDVLGGDDETWVADLDGVTCGLMTLRRDAGPGEGPGESGWIDLLYLDPSWIGRGLGDRCVEVAKQHLPHGIQLWVFQVNGPARRFYARHGFAEVEATDGAANMERCPDVRMQWRGVG